MLNGPFRAFAKKITRLDCLVKLKSNESSFLLRKFILTKETIMIRKVQFLVVAGLISGTTFAQKNADYAPINQSEHAFNTTTQTTDRALWDVQLNVDPTTVAAALAGCFWDGTQFWVAQWNSDSIYTLDATGAVTDDFVIAGVTGARSFTSDGTSLYIGSATTEIWEIDPVAKTLTSTISTSGLNCRYLTYDATLDGGSGGFWTGQYGDDINSVNMSGVTLSTLPATTHGLLGVYGMAYDDYTFGGPYLWAFDQSNTSIANIVQLDMTGNPTGNVYDTQADFAGGLGGGLWFGTFGGQAASIGGISQGTSLFVYERTQPAGLYENPEIEFSVFPNPVEETMTLSVNAESIVAVTIYSIDGKVMLNSSATVKTFDVSEFNSGIYVVEVETEKGIASQKFVKK